MEVRIVELLSGRLVGEFPVFISAENYTPTEREYFDLAWRCAIEDGLVKPECRVEYHFSMTA